MKKITILLVVFTMMLTISACDKSKEVRDPEITENEMKKEKPIVTIEMEGGETILIELYPNIAPNTVDNFVSLINKGYYNGLDFHRVIPGFMIQGGDPAGNGSGGPGYGIKGEFESNGIKNDLEHKREIISMARSANPDSAGSQFFIMVEDSPHLDGEYAAFGKVIEGMETVDQIANTEKDTNDKPLSPQIIKSMSVDLKGESYREPDTL